MPYLKDKGQSPKPMDCRILTAALHLFVHHGYHNVSVHDIQRKAKASIGSIYNHFDSKEGIARALYYHLLDEFEEMLADVIAEELTNIDRCNRIISLLFKYTESRHEIVEFMLYEKHRRFIPGAPPICGVAPFSTMQDIVKWGIENGEICQGSECVITSCVFGGAIRMIHLRLDGLIDRPLPELYDAFIAHIWQGLSRKDQGSLLRAVSG